MFSIRGRSQPHTTTDLRVCYCLCFEGDGASKKKSFKEILKNSFFNSNHMRLAWKLQEWTREIAQDAEGMKETPEEKLSFFLKNPWNSIGKSLTTPQRPSPPDTPSKSATTYSSICSFYLHQWQPKQTRLDRNRSHAKAIPKISISISQTKETKNSYRQFIPARFVFISPLSTGRSCLILARRLSRPMQSKAIISRHTMSVPLYCAHTPARSPLRINDALIAMCSHVGIWPPQQNEIYCTDFCLYSHKSLENDFTGKMSMDFHHWNVIRLEILRRIKFSKEISSRPFWKACSVFMGKFIWKCCGKFSQLDKNLFGKIQWAFPGEKRRWK